MVLIISAASGDIDNLFKSYSCNTFVTYMKCCN